MKTILLVPLLLGTTLALGACANKADANADTAAPAADAAAAAAPAATDTAAAAPTEATPPAAEATAGAGAQDHAAMDAAAGDHADTQRAATAAKDVPATAGASGVQAGWYTAGTFRACGSAQAMKIDKTAEIDAQIKKGGMSAGDPVYVQVEGMPMGDAYMLTRVVQVGSKTPVRDCPMTGTTTQVGG